MEEDKKQQEVRVGQWRRGRESGQMFRVDDVLPSGRAFVRYFGEHAVFQRSVAIVAATALVYDPPEKQEVTCKGVPVGSRWRVNHVGMDSHCPERARVSGEVIEIVGQGGALSLVAMSDDGRITCHGPLLPDFCTRLDNVKKAEETAAAKPAVPSVPKQMCAMPNCKALPPYSSPTRLHGTLCWTHYQEREKQLAAAVQQEDLTKLAGRLNAAATEQQRAPAQSHCLRAGTGVWSLRAR